MEIAAIVLRWRGQVHRPIRVEFAHSGIRFRGTLEPHGVPMIDPNALTDCQNDILEVLKAAAPKRLTKTKIIEALEQADKIHGESTVAMALPIMVKRGLILGPRPRSRDGYGIPCD